MNLAEAVATLLEEKPDELRISPNVEAVLRASIAAAESSINTYLAVLGSEDRAIAPAADAKRRTALPANE